MVSSNCEALSLTLASRAEKGQEEEQFYVCDGSNDKRFSQQPFFCPNNLQPPPVNVTYNLT